MSSHYVPHTKVPTLVFPTAPQASRHVALMIESLIRQNNSAGRPTVLGLPTGSHAGRPVPRADPPAPEAGLDFSRVVTFNLDEYYPDAAGRSAELPPLDARDVLQPRQHPAAEHPRPRRHHAAGRGRGLLHCATSSRSAGRAASTCRCSASAAPATSASTNPARRAHSRTAHGHARSGDAPRRGQRASSARTTCRTRP